MKRSKLTPVAATVMAAAFLFGGCSLKDDLEKRTAERKSDNSVQETSETAEETTVSETTVAETTEETTEATTEETTSETTTETTETSETTEATETTETTSESEKKPLKLPDGTYAIPDYEPEVDFPKIDKPMDIVDDLYATYNSFNVDYLISELGVSAAFEKEWELNDGRPAKDYMPDIAGLTGSLVADLDGDGTIDMITTGFAKREAEGDAKDDHSYEYVPYLILTQADYDSISVKDVFFFAPEDPEGYGYGSTLMNSTQSTANDYLYYISPDNTLIMTLTSSGLVGDGGYASGIELTVKDGQLVPVKMLYQAAGGSDGFEYAVYDLTADSNGVFLDPEGATMFPSQALALTWKDPGTALVEVKFDGDHGNKVTYSMLQPSNQ